MKNLKVGNIAFWHHSGLGSKPFLGGVIKKIHRANSYPGPGHVGTEEYAGYWHKPAFCLSPKEGRELLGWIEHLHGEKMRQIAEVERRFGLALSALLPRGVPYSRDGSATRKK